MGYTRRTFARSTVTLATAYADQSDADSTESSLVIPENLTELSDADLAELSSAAETAFSDVYGDGTNDLSEDDLTTLAGLTEGIEALAAESGARQEAADKRRSAAAELAARALSTNAAESEEDGDGDDDTEVTDEATETEDEGEQPEAPAAEESTEEASAEQPEPVVASAPAPRRTAQRIPRRRQAPAPQTGPDLSGLVTATTDAAGFSQGQSIDWTGVGKIMDRRLASYNAAGFASAAKAGKSMRQQHAIAAVRRPAPAELIVTDDGAAASEKAMNAAVDQSRLPQGSLVAAGGWCAPSETLYDLLDTGATREGLISVPEVQISRGGLSFTRGPDFAEVYAEGGFAYTEEEDIAGDYDGEGGGTKPCFRVGCPEFEEVRLELAGLCISAGILQQRGYPEMLGHTVQNALVAHDHRMAGRLVQRIVAGSTEVTMPSPQAGALAPLLTSIELQVEHYKYTHRLGRGATVEAVFPFWVRGAIRSDLALRTGIELFSVTDAQITGWFSERGVNPQFIYNWQDVNTTAAGEFVTWPESVQFLIYSAGTWVKGVSDIITIDNLYDSTLLGVNDFTALFTEEGWLLAKRGRDSRVVNVPLCANGATAAAVAIECDGVVAEGGSSTTTTTPAVTTTTTTN